MRPRFSPRVGVLSVLLLALLLGLLGTGAAAAQPAGGPREANWERLLELSREHGQAGVIVVVEGQWPALAARGPEDEQVRERTRQEQNRVAEDLGELGGERIVKLRSEPWVIAFLDTQEILALRERGKIANVMAIPPDAKIECPDQECDLKTRPAAPGILDRISPESPTNPEGSSWGTYLAITAALLLITVVVALMLGRRSKPE